MNLDRNIVIEASAGTGKTYTLVQTILQALFQKKLPMDTLVALTFTKKAAGEMKERIAAELQKIDRAEAMEESWRSWGHALPELKSRAREALETIDRAAIGTIHSYCFSLLKRFPLAAGINPDAEVDDKNIHGDDFFERQWPAWLRIELATRSPRRAEWLEILEKVSLDKIRGLARRLCDFDVPLDCLPLSEGAGEQGSGRALPLLTQLLKPFIAKFRASLLAEGYLSNNALLVLARELVARDRKVRETLKRDIRMIFVDEFQDTDPLQGELLLFLAEKPSSAAKKWQEVALEPGKLFIVGDPKQSIYRFRGADIAAYKGITDLVLEQGGELQSLEESYRSQEQIIHLVNAAFASLIQEKHPISPAYRALAPRRRKEDRDRHLVELRLAASEEPQASDDALAREAQDAASWISSNVLPPTSDVRRGTLDELRYRDIALVFRSAPAMPYFIDQLRAWNIPFVVEGERYFYRTPEVTDVLNLLRVLDDHGNRIALAGFLRSALGGFTDVELALLQSKNGLRLYKPLPPELGSPAHEGAWELLRRLASRVRRKPLKDILNHVYEDTYLLELAARSYHRDQTIANLLKLKRLMESFAEEGETTLRGLLSKINRFMEDDKLEGESPLADETYDAVRLLTIHKAKGLEFPVVWLPGLHRGRRPNRNTQAVRVQYDWSSGRLGVSLGKDLRNADDLALEEEARAREEAEERRVLYVAMTRARDHLILSGGVDLKRPSKDSFLNQLTGAWGLDLDSLKDGEISIGESTLSVRRITGASAKPAPASKPAPSWLDKLQPVEFAKTWKDREKECERAMETRLIQTPTSLVSTEHLVTSTESKQRDSVLSARSSLLQLGTLVHRFLESWDFACEKCDMPARLRVVANHYFASQGLLKEPFPDPKNGDKTNNTREVIEVVEEAQRLLADFIGSEAWEEIKGSTILGREVPFFYQVASNEHRAPSHQDSLLSAHNSVLPLMRGFMDILYRTPKGQLVIGDYKTDKELDPAKYAEQGKAYEEAVSRALGEKPIFKLIRLREGSAVAL